jgi:hypothetical protein
MRSKAFFLSILAAAFLTASQVSAGAVKLVYRVDDATAEIINGHLVILANGAVKSGGWDRAQLRVLEPSAPEAEVLEVEFVARPPAPTEAVVQALLPVATRKVARLPSYATVKVKIIAETNSIVVPINR